MGSVPVLLLGDTKIFDSFAVKVVTIGVHPVVTVWVEGGVVARASVS